MLTEDTTMDEWCSNGQGGFIAWRVAQFFYFASTGKHMTEAEAIQLVAEAAAKAKSSRPPRS